MGDLGLGLLAFIVVFIPLIVIHELGHMLACKSVGIAVLEFGLGFPPRVAKLFRWGETDFTLNAIPMGGFVMPFGESFVSQQSDSEVSQARQDLMDRGLTNPKSVFEAKPWQKIWFLFAGPLFNLITALVLFIVVPLTGAAYTRYDVQITDVYPDSEASLKALREGDLVTAVNGQSFDGAAELESILEDYLAANPGGQVTFTISRPLTGQTFDTTMTPAEQEEDIPLERVRILEVQSDSPALEAGLLANDIIISANGQEINTLEEMQEITAAHDGEEIIVVVERDKEQVEVPVVPRRLGDEDTARIGITINFVVFSPAFGFVVDDNDASREFYTKRLSVMDSIDYGVNKFTTAMELIVRFPSELIRGNLSAQEARPIGPVGVSQVSVEIAQERPYQDFIDWIALISIALAVTNLLPIPGLDGGRILFVLVEMVRGKPMEPEREGVVHLMGFFFLIIIGVAVLALDILYPVQDQIR